MPKIKNWSKVGENTWENDETGFKVRVKEDGIMRGFYIVEGKKPNGPWFEMKAVTGGNPLDNKQDVIDLTVDWMKKNPNPESSL